LQGRPALDTMTSTSGRSSAKRRTVSSSVTSSWTGTTRSPWFSTASARASMRRGGSVNALSTTSQQRLHEVTAQSAVRARHECVRSTKLHGDS